MIKRKDDLYVFIFQFRRHVKLTRMDLKVIICVLMFFETVLTYRNFKYNDLIHADLFSNKIPRRPNHRNRHNNKLGNSVDEQIPGFMRYAPKQHDLKLKRLIKKLGDDFNDKWMSIERPIDDNQNVITISGSENIDSKLLKDFATLNMTLTDNENAVANVSDHTLDLFKRWLLLHGTCSVHFVWTDIGSLFWPRWIRKGKCSTEVSCSWPPGMSCVPTEGEVIGILRWNCRKGKRKGRKGRRNKNKYNNDMKELRRKRRDRYGGMRCKWLKVPYAVNSKCICSC